MTYGLFKFFYFLFKSMKKNTIKAFTLVEMLIVIVIIGILIASLMPRMQTAQGRARDVARKNDLSQIQTAIITSQQDRGKWPQIDSWAKRWMAVSWTSIENELKTAGMTAVPKDPNGSNIVYWLGSWSVEWAYQYMVTKRNWVDNAWFALMAKTEVEWWSNWVVCNTGGVLNQWSIKEGEDLKNITTCTSLVKTWGTSCAINSGACEYSDIAQLRYILVY